ncbi:unnamed protein product [Spirodela intermedia]|uniref:Late embryogenesis abundant protein LEA-2 subgroup domain-containing protein n=1 Tax=Spirodela intermedia TaxID=51605 RepID=A0A7I8JNB4_SPIIN|nr:unnamed protein product [Spirodela intermedia]CAA6671667.1 unnamed protein product [Spirodela intermedia]
MAERIYPSAKHGGANGAAAGGAAAGPAFPAPKAQMYGSARPIYRPQQSKARRRGGRRCSLCCCCCWITLILIALIFMAAIAGESSTLSAFNVTTANAFSSRLNVSLAARNPNKKLVFVYDSISVSVSTGGVGIGDGSFPSFVHEARNTTLLKTTVASAGQSLETSAASDLKKKSSLALEIRLETKAGVKLGGMKTKRVRIRVTCDGINVAVPKGKVSPTVSSPDASCNVELRIKIWKWYL